MRLGDRVRSTVALPSIPVGTTGTVHEVGHLFIAVSFDDGRIGYYARRQLARLAGDNGSSAPVDCAINLGFTREAIPAGSHLCLVGSTENEARAIAAEYLIAGLRAGETCICWAGRCWSRALQAILTAKGVSFGGSNAVSFLDPKDVYFSGLEFTADKQLARVEAALADFRGRRLRLLGRPGKALRDIPQNEWWDYEMRVTHLLREHGATAMCCYGAAGISPLRHAQAIHPYVVKKGRLAAHDIAVV